MVDPQIEAAQARLEAMRTGRQFRNKKPVPPLASKPVQRDIKPKGYLNQLNIESIPLELSSYYLFNSVISSINRGKQFIFCNFLATN